MRHHYTLHEISIMWHLGPVLMRYVSRTMLHRQMHKIQKYTRLTTTALSHIYSNELKFHLAVCVYECCLIELWPQLPFAFSFPLNPPTMFFFFFLNEQMELFYSLQMASSLMPVNLSIFHNVS